MRRGALAVCRRCVGDFFLLVMTMRTLLLLALLAFVLSVGYALPFSEDEAQNDELKDIADDFEMENPNRYDGDTKEVICQKHLRWFEFPCL